MQVRPGSLLKTCLKEKQKKPLDVNSYHVLEIHSPPCLGFKAKKKKKKKEEGRDRSCKFGLQVTVSEWER